MMNIQVTLKIPSCNGSPQIISAGSLNPPPSPEDRDPESKLSPYREPKLTASDEPTLIESISFVRIG
jgi:hypothetical protein